MPKPFARPQPLEVALIPDALLTIRTACAVGGMSPATLYRRSENDPNFPKLIKHGTRCTRIRAGDLMAYLRAQGEVRA